MASTGGWLNPPAWLRTAVGGRHAPRAPAITAAPLPSGRIRVEPPDQLLAPTERAGHIQAIEDLTRVTSAHFETLYRQALQNYAAHVQQLRASEAHYHAGIGGLLDHGLEAAVYALKLRRAHLLPPGAPTEPGHQRPTAEQRRSGHGAVPAQGLVLGADGRALTPWSRARRAGGFTGTTCRPATTRSMRGPPAYAAPAAGRVEAALLEQLRGLLRAPGMVADVVGRATGLDPTLDEAQVTVAMIQLDQIWDQLFPAEQSRIVRLLVERVIVSPNNIEVRLRANGIEELALELRQAVPEKAVA